MIIGLVLEVPSDNSASIRRTHPQFGLHCWPQALPPPVVVSLAGEGGETTAAPFNKLLDFNMLATGAEYGWSSRNLMIPWMLSTAYYELVCSL
jgi:hypothetical protein